MKFTRVRHIYRFAAIPVWHVFEVALAIWQLAILSPRKRNDAHGYVLRVISATERAIDHEWNRLPVFAVRLFEALFEIHNEFRSAVVAAINHAAMNNNLSFSHPTSPSFPISAEPIIGSFQPL